MPSDIEHGAAEMEQVGLDELARILIRHQGIQSGLYTVAIRFQFGFTSLGPKDSRFPGAFMGVDAVGLKRVKEPGYLIVDAAEVQASGDKVSKRRKKTSP